MTWLCAPREGAAVLDDGDIFAMVVVPLPRLPSTGALVGMGIPMATPLWASCWASQKNLGGKDIPVRMGILVSMCSSWLGLAFHPCQVTGAQHTSAEWDTGCMSKAPFSAKILLKILANSEAPGLTAMQIPLMITVTF